MDLSTYKALLFDIDKTLTDSTKRISPRTIEALKGAASFATVGACTGRHFATVGPVLSSLFPAESLHILAGGALILRTDGTILHEELIDAAITKEIIQLSELHAVRLVIQDGESVYGNDLVVQHNHDYALPGYPQVMAQPTSTMKRLTVPIMVASELNDVFLDAIASLPISVKRMENYHGKTYIDITAKGVTKAHGVEYWCRMQGIDAAQIIGFGDSENDLEFLRAVGYAVAMGNAVDDIKKIADEVTASCDDDGVAVWIEGKFEVRSK